VKGAPGWSPKRPRDRKSPGKWIIVVSSWERVYIIRQSCLSHRMYHVMLLNLPVCDSEYIDVKFEKMTHPRVHFATNDKLCVNAGIFSIHILHIYMFSK
jgi:hypothetical protein